MTDLSLRFTALSFVNALALREEPGLINPWTTSTPEGAARHALLRAHLWQPMPQYALISAQSTREDAGVTGVPLISQSAIDAGLVPYLARPSGPVEKVTLDYSCSIWRALNLHGMGRYSVAFSLLPLLTPGGRPAPRDLLRRYAPFALTIIKFYPGIRVIAMGNVASEILLGADIIHSTLHPPQKVGRTLFEQLQILQAQGLPQNYTDLSKGVATGDVAAAGVI